MSKIDREITAVLDDMGTQAAELVPKMFAKMADDDLGEEEMFRALATLMEETKPKTYDDYIKDLKLVFKQNGWLEP